MVHDCGDRDSERTMDAGTRDGDVLTIIRKDRREALDRLFPLLYEELRGIAHRQLSARRHGAEGTPTLVTTALVNEAYLKLVDQSRADWRDRAHFLALAAVAMRHILVDRARSRASAKRGGPRRAVTLDDEVVGLDDQAELILEIEDGMRTLESLNPRLARVVEARFFAGLSEEETAEALGVTARTVQRDWVKARMLLRRALSG